MRRLLLLPLVILALCATACLPETALRRSALVPAPAGPAMTGRPLERGELKLTGGLNPMSLAPATVAYGFPAPGDPGLFIPAAQLTGSLYVGLTPHLEVGAELHGAPFSWAEPTSDGVFPLPNDGTLASFTGGLGLRLTRRLGALPLWFGLSGELNLSNVPQASFVRCGCGNGEPASYSLDHVEDNLFLLPNLFAQLGGDVGEHFHLSLLGGWEASVRNVGFEPDLNQIDNSSLSAYSVYLVGAGVEARAGWLRFETNLLVPVSGDESIQFGPELVTRMSAVL